MPACVGYPICGGVMQGERHVRECPLYVEAQVEEITEPTTAPQPTMKAENLATFIITKAVIADSVENALKLEPKGLIVGINRQ